MRHSQNNAVKEAKPVAFYTSNFLAKRRTWWMKNIHKVQAKVGSNYVDGTIQRKAIEGNNIVIHAVFSGLNGGAAATITGIRIIDIDGEVAAEQPDNVSVASGQGAIFKITLPITEGAV